MCQVIDRSDGFVVQMGDNDPAGEVHGFKPAGASAERTIPLEVSLKGDKELIYGITGEDSGTYVGGVIEARWRNGGSRNIHACN